MEPSYGWVGKTFEVYKRPGPTLNAQAFGATDEGTHFSGTHFYILVNCLAFNDFLKNFF